MNKKPPILGVLGGMGPVVTAEFLKSIYEYNQFIHKEQETPNVIVFSLPSIPDRNNSINTGNEREFIDFIQFHLENLNKIVDHIVIGCCLAHYSLPEIPEHLTEKVISLIKIADQELQQHDESALLLASTGTYTKKLFQEGCAAAERIISLSETEQDLIDDMIFKILKRGQDPLTILPDIQALLDKYNTRSYISGCTEFHLFTKSLKLNGIDSIKAIDPLSTIAQNFFQIFDYNSL
ncbi:MULTISPECIES: aspartate/glutamate racemase family protein [Cyanophyceae]|uniref:Aspartate racemase n=1 Tax=Nodularia spumigena CENA596 TaxID=1819295 RepID=A0A166JJ58_NODSP|nr:MULTISPECIES: aspartate/glutamate racemase family protein [Cyanophyceae]MDB9357839.1 aspartate/glutamate racemase family protein [Nodularia spumigena CS-587/03]KZL49779.1 aspartate racemase [Nodularia spumigena CENA596]MDB9320232.1 aspartate/glutamate racemase family protein [Nodularia spumigena CS-590/01A]MDB9324886.1 aspartate/glutamate racemase family protein [Nodularia spumigena CS-590/02]MDB9333851.1 aspartate/glutamate racemase family protein [Nodularia spumigena CS-590/01]